MEKWLLRCKQILGEVLFEVTADEDPFNHFLFCQLPTWNVDMLAAKLAVYFTTEVTFRMNAIY